MQSKAVLSGWGNYPLVSAPQTHPRQPDNAKEQSSYHPRGLGRSYGDAGLPAQEHAALNTHFLDRFISFDPQTGVLEAEAGVSLEQILKYFIPKGWFLPVTPGTKFVTLGGAIASNVHGKNHHHKGSIENFIEEMTVQTPIGTLRCSREERPDLFHATISGYGLTGLIERAKLRLRKVETSFFATHKLIARNLQEAFDYFDQHDAGYEFSAAWIDTLATGRSMGRSVLFFGNHARRDQLPPKLQRNPLQVANKFKVTVPFYAPNLLLNRYSLKLFNQAFYTKNALQQGDAIEDYDTFFYPLDIVNHWNRMYGRRGFLQYQFIIPDPKGKEGMEVCLEYLSRNGIGSFLSVLKRYGDDHPMLPFAKAGYSLALDLPYDKKTLAKLDELDKLVLQYDGRVYLSKDARLSPETFRAMYPEYEAWRAVIDKYNPERRVWSHLAERLAM